MNKKLSTCLLFVMVLNLTISGNNAYTDGEIIFEENIEINANSYQSRIIELNSSELDLNQSNQGLRMISNSNISSQLDMVVLYNETEIVFGNITEYYEFEFVHIIENLTENRNVEFSYPGITPNHNLTGDDPYSFLIIIYNQDNEKGSLNLQILFDDEITVLDNTKKTYFPISFLILSIITVTYVRSIRYYRRKNKI